MDEQQFLSGLGGGGVVGLLYLIFKLIQAKCKNTKSKSNCNSGCFSCEIEASELTKKNTEKIEDLEKILIEIHNSNIDDKRPNKNDNVLSGTL